MANTVAFGDEFYFAISGLGKIQPNKDTPMLTSDIDTRQRCTFVVEDNVERNNELDCQEVDLMDQVKRTQFKRIRLTYTNITPQEKAIWYSYFLGNAAISGGPTQNEIQVIKRIGSFTGGSFKFGLALEGFSALSQSIPWDATPEAIQEKITDETMKWIQADDIRINGGLRQTETLTFAGTANATNNLVLTIIADNSPALDGAGKTVNVPIESGDIASVVAGKAVTALRGDTDVNAFFNVSAVGAVLTLEAKAAAANDPNLGASYTTSFGMTGATSVLTQPGAPSDDWGFSKQAFSLTIVGTANESENLAVTVEAADMPNSPKTIQVPIVDLDTASVIAGKIRAALIADVDVGHPDTGFFTIGGIGAAVTGEANTAADTDPTIEASVENAHGVTGASSTQTAMGIAPQLELVFQNRLGGAALPMATVYDSEITGGGTIEVSRIQAGNTYHHEMSRATSREKVRFGFIIGRLVGSDPAEKYSGFVVENLGPSLNRRLKAGFDVSLVGLFTPEEVVGYSEPPCVKNDGLESWDSRLQVDGNWETPDINTLTAPFDDQVILDETAYGWIGLNPDLLARAKSIIYNMLVQIFCYKNDPIAVIANAEAFADLKLHLGMPGNRTSLLMPQAKVKFQSGERFSRVGASERMAGNFELTGTTDGINLPFSAEAWLDQDEPFLQVSE